jgi:polyhydroxybutyrate depolymerase
MAFFAIFLTFVFLTSSALLAFRHTFPKEPKLPGKIERGELEHGGRTRTWITYVPSKPHPPPALVIALHSSMGTAEGARQSYGYDFDLLAEGHGFIAVYPQGYKGHWNDCKLKGPFAAKAENVDDVGFLQALVERLVKDYNVDRSHIYVTGVSNGGAMTIRLALQTPEFARAYAAVVANLPSPENMAISPTGKPVSMLLMNGTADPMNPWNGGDVVLYGVYGNRGRVLSTEASIDYFRKLDGLEGPPAKTQLPDIDRDDGSTVERESWTASGRPNVTLVKVRGGGHSVPHPAMYNFRLLGNSNRDFHAANEIWEFFQEAP